MSVNDKNNHIVDYHKTPLERLLWVQQHTEKNTKDFAEYIGMTAPALHNLKARGSRVSKTLAYAVELKTGISADWILHGNLGKYVDPRVRLDSKEQALLELMVPLSSETLRLLFFRNLENRISREETGFSQATDALIDEKARAKLQKRSVRKLKWFGELSSIIDGLQSGNLDQVCIIPLLLSLHYGPRWSESCERSQDYQQMISFGLKAKFEDVIKRSQRILKKLNDLYQLSPEQEEQLQKKNLNPSAWIPPD